MKCYYEGTCGHRSVDGTCGHPRGTCSLNDIAVRKMAKLTQKKDEFRYITISPKIVLEEKGYGWHIHLVDDSGEKYVDFLHNCVFQEITEALKAVELIHRLIESINIRREGYHITKLVKIEE